MIALWPLLSYHFWDRQHTKVSLRNFDYSMYT